MAGLQYYFFPTDFYYPRPKPVPGTNTADVDVDVNVDVDPRPVPSPQPEDGRNTNYEKAAAEAAALVYSDVNGKSKKPRGNLPRKALVLSPRETGEERRRLEAVVADSRNKSDRNL
ncbi:PNPLA domain-containing protein [Psidium guajava]|nr:PNPLA domain-containing protein [Psidium guajava]